MNHWISKYSAQIAVFAAITSCLCLFWIALGAFGGKAVDDAGAYGAMGRTLGALGTLVTGLALVGLLAVIVLQHRQIQQEKRDLEENRRVLLRQARDEALTARINANLALLEALRARRELATEYWQGYCQEEVARESRKLRLEVAILLCEAGLDFDRGDRTVDIERQAIEIYLKKFLVELHHRCIEHRKGELISNLKLNLENARMELMILADRVREHHRPIETKLREMIEKICAYCDDVTRRAMDDEQIAGEVGGYLRGLIAEGSGPGRIGAENSSEPSCSADSQHAGA